MASKNRFTEILKLHKSPPVAPVDPDRLRTYNQLRLAYWGAICDTCVLAAEHHPGSEFDRSLRVAAHMAGIVGSVEVC